jgi:hypothetical protein
MPQYFSGYDVNKFSNLPKLPKLGGGSPFSPEQEEEALNSWFEGEYIQIFMDNNEKMAFKNADLYEKKKIYNFIMNEIQKEKEQETQLEGDYEKYTGSAQPRKKADKEKRSKKTHQQKRNYSNWRTFNDMLETRARLEREGERARLEAERDEREFKKKKETSLRRFFPRRVKLHSYSPEEVATNKWIQNPKIQEFMSDDDRYLFLHSTLEEKIKLSQLIENRIEAAKREEKREKLLSRPPPTFPREDEEREGGKLSVRDLKNLLNASYDISTPTGDFVEDKKLSTATSKVFVNTKTGQAVVSHRGTEGASDWLNNAAYGLFGEWGYKKTPRYKEAEKVQKNAEKKYGAKKVSTIGHSQGGLQAQILGKNSRETITLNKATRLGSNTAPNTNEYDVRSSGDVVSALNPFRQNTGRDIIIPKTSYNPLSQHSIDILDQLPQDEMIGQGRRKRGGLIGESQLYKGGKYNSLVYSS